MAKAPFLGLLTALLPLTAAQAAPATSDEAARLTTLFSQYVSTPAAGQPPSVTVTPSGDSYKVVVDLQQALKGLESFGITIDRSLSTTMLTPLADGTWKVDTTDSQPIVAHAKGDVISVKAASTAFTGVYDPRMYAFKSVDAHYTGYDYSRTGPTLVQNSHTEKIDATFSGAPADGGTVTGTAHETVGGTNVAVVIKPASAAPPTTPGTAIGYTAPSATLDLGMEKLHTKNLLDLWAFLVAHPNHDSLAAAQDDFRSVLRAVLPLASGLKESASTDGFSVTTPVGVISAKSASTAFGVADLDGSATVTTGLTIGDLVVPSDQLPPWSLGLVPTGLSLNIKAEGFRPADAAAEAVNDFDLKSDKPFTTDQTARIGHLAMPGAAVVTLLPSRLTSKLLDLKLDGAATIGTVPDGHVTIRSTGLDKAIASLQAASGSDPSAAQALGPLVLAKNLAKPEPDGSLSWVVEVKGNGPVTVNGTPLQ